MEVIMALILAIATEVGVPPNFALAIALEENWTLNPNAMSKPNKDGTRDLGIMQLNSKYFGDIDWKSPEVNIRTGCEHIKWLMNHSNTSTMWSVAIAYNAGITRVDDPPKSSLGYADRVIDKYTDLCNGYVRVLTGGQNGL